MVLAGAVGVADRSHIGAGTRVGGMSGIHGTVPGGETVIGLPAVPYGDWLREQAAMRKLPELVRQLRDLRTRVSELENSRPG